jgi:hypothetical protein
VRCYIRKELDYWEVYCVSESISEKLAKIGESAQEYKEAVVERLKDMEVDVKQWNFNVGKTEEEYTVEVILKLGIKPKKK